MTKLKMLCWEYTK